MQINREEAEKETGEWTQTQLIKAEDAVKKLVSGKKLAITNLIKGFIKNDLIKISATNIGNTIKKTVETFMDNKMNVILFTSAIIHFYNGKYGEEIKNNGNSNKAKKYERLSKEWYKIQQYIMTYAANENIKAEKVWCWLQLVYNTAVEQKRSISDLTILACCNFILTSNSTILTDTKTSKLQASLKKSEEEKKLNTKKDDKPGNNSNKNYQKRNKNKIKNK